MAENKNAVAAANAAEQPVAAPENVNVAENATSVEPAAANGRAAKIKALAASENNSLKTVVIKKIDVVERQDKNGQMYLNAIVRLGTDSNIPVSLSTNVNGTVAHTLGAADTLQMPLNSFLAAFQRVDRYAVVIDKIAEMAEVSPITDFFIGVKVDVLSVFVPAGVIYNDVLRRNSTAEAAPYDRYFNSIVGVKSDSNPIVDASLATANKLVWQDRMEALKARREAAAAAAKAAANVVAIDVDAAF